MARGRKPLAQEVKDRSGAYAKNPQRKNKTAPSADGQSPKMPRWLGKHAKEKWKELVADLKSNGVLSTDTREIMIAYCTAYEHWRQAREAVAENGLAIVAFDKEGNRQIVRNAYVAEMHKFREQMNKLLPEFGLTPASRQKLTSLKIDDKTEDPFARIMERMGRG